MPSGIPFGEYRLIRRLGAGGMAEVFLAKRPGPAGFEKQLVIKRILPHLARSERVTSMFLNEARFAALIDHPHLVHVSDFGEIDGNFYMAMEFVDGITAAELMGTLGQLTPGVACRIAVDILDALQAVHNARDEQGVPLQLVHRDVSPRNVLITRAGAGKLLDFGIAVAATTGEHETKQPVGTRRYMSPEQLASEPLDSRSDLFCVAVLLFEMITGRPPFSGIPRELPPRPEEIPKELWRIMSSAMSIHRAERPRTAREFQAELELFLQARGIEGTRAHLAELLNSLMPEHYGIARRALTKITRLTQLGVNPIRPLVWRLSDAAGGLLGEPGHRAPRFGLVLVVLLCLIGAGAWAYVNHAAKEKAELATLEGGSDLEIEDLEGEEADATDEQMTDEEVESSETVPTAVRTQDADNPEVPPEQTKAKTPPAKAKPKTTKRVRRGRYGYLSLSTRPRTVVFMGGKRIGRTPIQKLRLPAGKHVLELRNKRLGIKRRVRVRVRRGKVTRLHRQFR